MTAQHRMSLTEWGLLALLSLLWGGSFFFAKIAVGALPPLPLWSNLGRPPGSTHQ